MSTKTEKANEARVETLVVAIDTGAFDKALEAAGIGPSQLADQLGIEKAVVSKIVNGRRTPTTRGKAGLALAGWYQKQAAKARRKAS